jgi:hypothetical protein
MNLAFYETAQHSVLRNSFLSACSLWKKAKRSVAGRLHPTGGTLRIFRHFSWLEVDSDKIALSRPTHQRVTRAVETVEKAPFQKPVFEKWGEDIEKRLVFCILNNILAIFEPVMGKFV